ncbi:flagellin [uncultured Roseobacter sp.]|uniref:flagellin n=1 Tax=uncultured Roseobacter sp. TaxID=114847 RepID=UPI00261473BE|nr:flagellin [uncultured Roseobacter sp.]
MSSILTNNSAMVALQTLKSINMNLGKVQSEISTGKTVESAKDNAAVWAISKVMSSDVKGFEAISDSLALGQATVGVALNASESITDLLTEIKGKIVNSQEENVDRAKIQTDIEALTEQIGSIVGAAQFNGLNLLNDDGIATEDQTSNILSSLDRAGDGTVTSGEISVTRANLGTDKATVDAAADFTAGSDTTGGAATDTLTATTTSTQAVDIDGTSFASGTAEGSAFIIQIAGAGTFAGTDWETAGNVANADIAYVAQEGDTAADVAAGLKAAFDVFRVENGLSTEELSVEASGGNLVWTGGTDATNTLAVTINVADATDGSGNDVTNTRAGSLSMLSALDVSTEEGSASALDAIEGLIQTSIDTAASLGSAGSRIETQADFVGKLSDLLTSGIGALVDADMEAASAKLQALQTQQQLGVQALSIANQAPQTILSLFR